MKRQLTCACCGGDAGRWTQWHNQDAGWGLCPNCAAWIAGRRDTDLDRTYGLPGVHREAPTFTTHGRRFNVLASFSNTPAGEVAANSFMAVNENASLLAIANGRVILADKDDMGEPDPITTYYADRANGAHAAKAP